MIFIETLHIPSKLCSHFQSTLSSQIDSVMFFQVTKWTSLLWGSDRHPTAFRRRQRTNSHIERASSDHREDSERWRCRCHSVWLEVCCHGPGQIVPDYLHPVHRDGHHPPARLSAPCHCNLVHKIWFFSKFAKFVSNSNINQIWNKKVHCNLKCTYMKFTLFSPFFDQQNFSKTKITRNHFIEAVSNSIFLDVWKYFPIESNISFQVSWPPWPFQSNVKEQSPR